MMKFKKQKMIPLIFKLIMAILAWLPAKAQVLEYYPIDDKLQEISGLELLNDSTLIAFNDGGNKSEIYLLNLKGEILRTVDVEDTKNRDWEDIAIDKEYVYIGDIGNNENKRDNLSIVKLKISDILTRDEVEAETISFRYQEQTAFPPKMEEMYYDAEGMTICGDSIWIFTKRFIDSIQRHPVWSIKFLRSLVIIPFQVLIKLKLARTAGGKMVLQQPISMRDCFIY